MTRAKSWFIFLSCLMAGCTSVPPPYDDDVACMIEERTLNQVEWRPVSCSDIQERVQCLLNQELTPHSAVQIAFLNNPQIQALFEELGIAYADLVEAGLLTNPAFEVDVRYPNRSRLVTDVQYLVTTAFLDLFLIPLRTRVATAEFEKTKLKVTNEILNLSFEVRQTYYALLFERQKLEPLQGYAELANIYFDIVTKQNQVGNVRPIDLQLIQARYLEAELVIARSKTEIIRLTEKLHRLLGLDQEICFHLPLDIPCLIFQTFDLCTIESIALQERLDLQAAYYEVIRIQRMLGLKEWWVYTDLRVGVSGELEPEGYNIIGPGFIGSLPIFNWGQAARLKLCSQLRQAKDRAELLKIHVLSEVREAHKLLTSYLEIINDYKKHLLPLQEDLLLSSEKLYNVMGMGINQLIENKQIELMAKQNYLEANKQFWMEQVALDRSLGGYLYRLMETE